MPFTLYIDDSGTDPKQAVAIANALIVPAKRIAKLETEWGSFSAKEHFMELHTSECVARNRKSEYADWTDAKVHRVLHRAGQITRKYAVAAYFMAVYKKHYDQIVPSEVRQYAGQYHYTWAIRHLLRWVDRWAEQANYASAFEYIYDSMARGEAKTEIQAVMEQAERTSVELGKPGMYVKYSFGRRQDVPALQCSDLVASTCYQEALFVYRDIPLNAFARKSWDYLYGPVEGWLRAYAIKRNALADWVQRESTDGRALQRFRRWEEEGAARRKAKPPRHTAGNSEITGENR